MHLVRLIALAAVIAAAALPARAADDILDAIDQARKPINPATSGGQAVNSTPPRN